MRRLAPLEQPLQPQLWGKCGAPPALKLSACWGRSPSLRVSYRVIELLSVLDRRLQLPICTGLTVGPVLWVRMIACIPDLLFVIGMQFLFVCAF